MGVNGRHAVNEVIEVLEELADFLNKVDLKDEAASNWEAGALSNKIDELVMDVRETMMPRFLTSGRVLSFPIERRSR